MTMSLATVHGVVLDGVTGVVIRVEVAVSNGLPSVGVVGLPDASVSEARWRVRSAVETSGWRWPDRRITISLSPAEMRKNGAGLDLPIAVGVLVANGTLPGDRLEQTALIGELGLDGRLRPSHGMLAAVLAARDVGCETVIVPIDGAEDLDIVPGMNVVRAGGLRDACSILAGDGGGSQGQARLPSRVGSCAERTGPDFHDVRGHVHARWALEVAAAGGHHLAMVGAPGVGKTLLAQRLPTILPPLETHAALEVAAIHSVAGHPRSSRDREVPPFSAPHHSASAASLLGSTRGGRVIPGAVTLAHRGVLFLDEAAEFVRPALEGLRQPLESGEVMLSRTGWSGVLPARFQLIMAANPCPCGLRVGRGESCSCAPAAVRRYASRLSGPLMDRVDIRVSLVRPNQVELESGEAGESSGTIRDRVIEARARMHARFRDTPWQVNAEIPAGDLRRRWSPTAEGGALLTDVERASVNLRGVDRILRMAWTLADLGAIARPGADEIAAALALRGAHTGLAT